MTLLGCVSWYVIARKLNGSEADVAIWFLWRVHGGRRGGLSTATPPLHGFQLILFTDANRERFFAAAQNDRIVVQHVILSVACHPERSEGSSRSDYEQRFVADPQRKRRPATQNP